MKRLYVFLLLLNFILILACSGSKGNTAANNNGNGDGNEGDLIFISPNPDPANEYASTTIDTPSNKSLFNEGDTILFDGSGVDANNNPIESSNLIWTSSIDGHIGTGKSFSVNTLSPGLHLITLSLGEISSNNAEIRIAVGPVEPYHDTVINKISVGRYPNSIVVTPDSQYLYISNYGDNSISVIRASDYALINTITVGDKPGNLTVSLDGKFVYVINSFDKTISVIETLDNTVVDTISFTSQPISMAVSPDGTLLYVGMTSSDLYVFRTSDNSFVNRLSSFTVTPRIIKLHPDGSLVYVADQWDNTISVIRTSDNILNGKISLTNCYPIDIAITPEGYLYLAENDFKISVIQTSDNTVIKSIPLPSNPGHLMIPNKSYIYSGGYIIQTTNDTVIDRIPIGEYVSDITLTPDGKYIYVLNSHDYILSVIAKSKW